MESHAFPVHCFRFGILETRDNAEALHGMRMTTHRFVPPAISVYGAIDIRMTNFDNRFATGLSFK